MSGNDISWAICKSAPCPTQITTPAPNHSVFYILDAFPAAQPTASFTENIIAQMKALALKALICLSDCCHCHYSHLMLHCWLSLGPPLTWLGMRLVLLRPAAGTLPVDVWLRHSIPTFKHCKSYPFTLTWSDSCYTISPFRLVLPSWFYLSGAGLPG